MSILSENKVIIGAVATDKFAAIRMAGQLLVDAGHVMPEYIDKMIERENNISTYMGEGLAIPHGTKDAAQYIKSTGLSIVQFPAGVLFGDDEKAYLLVGIAAIGDEHLEILTNVAMVVSEEANMERILAASTPQEMIEIFQSGVES
ncbi:MAG: PTS sugar transporter subunit IIA [Gorillibacterium sp.]|nr:PTS sugar transporter subunit IIA [Gorillibacterium sp.]